MKMTNRIKGQLLAIRDSGETNMLATNMVQRLAFDRNFYDLVNFIEEDRKAYAHFILTGEAEWADGEVEEENPEP